jgi:hypothetical protein
MLPTRYHNESNQAWRPLVFAIGLRFVPPSSLSISKEYYGLKTCGGAPAQVRRRLID